MFENQAYFQAGSTSAKLKAVAALKAHLCEAGINSLEPTPSEAAASTASHEDLAAMLSLRLWRRRCPRWFL